MGSIAEDAAIITHSDPASSKYQFSYKAFPFQDYENRLLYLHCTARVCKADDRQSFCSQTCGGRKRRQAAEEPGSSGQSVIHVDDERTNFTLSTQGFLVHGQAPSTITLPVHPTQKGERSFLEVLIPPFFSD